MRSASLHSKSNGLQIKKYVTYLMDHCKLTVQVRVLGLHMLGLRTGKYLLLSFKERNSRTLADKCAPVTHDG